MNKKISSKLLDSLIDKAIVSEAEQDNAELGHALKNITPDQLQSLLKAKKVIPLSAINALSDKAVCAEAAQDNAELGHALKNLSRESLEKIMVSRSPKIIPFKKLVRERIMWAASIAAIIILSFPIGFHIANVSNTEGIQVGKCEMLYAYNMDEIPDISVGTKGGDMTQVPNITTLSSEQLKGELPKLETAFNHAEELQEVDIYGRILTMAYIKLGNGSQALEVLNSMKHKLSSEPEDYEETLTWCRKIIDQLQ